MGKVEWRPVVGWEGLYEVSAQGEVRSLSRVVHAKNFKGRVLARRFTGKPLCAFVTGKGYPAVKLSRQGGTPTTQYVHVLVTAAFIGPRPQGLETCHNNGDPTDNAVENLRYDTRAANARDSVRHGTCFLAGPNRPNRWERA